MEESYNISGSNNNDNNIDINKNNTNSNNNTTKDNYTDHSIKINDDEWDFVLEPSSRKKQKIVEHKEQKVEEKKERNKFDHSVMVKHINELTDQSRSDYPDIRYGHMINHQIVDMRCYTNEHTEKIKPFDITSNPTKTKPFNRKCIHCKNEICHLWCNTCRIFFNYLESAYICTKCTAYTKGMIDTDKSMQTFILLDILSPHTISFIHSCISSEELYNIVVCCQKDLEQRDQYMNAAVLCLELSKRSDVSNRREAYITRFNTILQELSNNEIFVILKRLLTWFNKYANEKRMTDILDTYAYHFEIFNKTFSQRQQGEWSNLAHGILTRFGTTDEEKAAEIAKRSGVIQKDDDCNDDFALFSDAVLLSDEELVKLMNAENPENPENP